MPAEPARDAPRGVSPESSLLFLRMPTYGKQGLAACASALQLDWGFFVGACIERPQPGPVRTPSPAPAWGTALPACIGQGQDLRARQR